MGKDVMRFRRKRRQGHRNATGCLTAALSAGTHGMWWVSPNHLTIQTPWLKRLAGPLNLNSNLIGLYSVMCPHSNGWGKLSRRKSQRSEGGNGRQASSSFPHPFCFVKWGLHNRVHTVHHSVALQIICYCVATFLCFFSPNIYIVGY